MVILDPWKLLAVSDVTQSASAAYILLRHCICAFLICVLSLLSKPQSWDVHYCIHAIQRLKLAQMLCYDPAILVYRNICCNCGSVIINVE